MRPEDLAHKSGLDFLRAMQESPPFGIAKLLGFRAVEVEPGMVAAEGTPDERHFNPMGGVHGGYAATLLDSCMGCAVLSALEAGKIFNTLEMNVHYVRALRPGAGPVRAEGRVVHAGARVATAEGRVVGPDGKLCAHGTLTALVLALPGASGSGAAAAS